LTDANGNILFGFNKDTGRIRWVMSFTVTKDDALANIMIVGKGATTCRLKTSLQGKDS
jgi:hypothetical protein